MKIVFSFSAATTQMGNCHQKLLDMRRKIYLRYARFAHFIWRVIFR